MESKKFGKYFVLIFLVSFLMINWSEISWIFNYRVVSGIVSDFFQKDGQEATAEPIEILEEKNTETFEYSEKENSVEIPILGISAPLIIVAEDSDSEEIHQALDRGVVHFPSSVLPGETGQTEILGHSAPPGWPKIKYDWVFSGLNDLKEGDEVFVYFNHKKYPYSVIGKAFLERGEEISSDLTNNNNVVVLISCWPPGKDLRRIAVEAELKK